MESRISKFQSFSMFPIEFRNYGILIFMRLHKDDKNGINSYIMSFDDTGHLRRTMLAMFASRTIETYYTMTLRKIQTISNRTESFC